MKANEGECCLPFGQVSFLSKRKKLIFLGTSEEREEKKVRLREWEYMATILMVMVNGDGDEIEGIKLGEPLRRSKSPNLLK